MIYVILLGTGKIKLEQPIHGSLSGLIRRAGDRVGGGDPTVEREG